ncbi:MAG: hypothetical protein WAN66_23445 [Limnoraphis robusta]|uniref:Polymerase nucleotidyl transferase domain-containing protein n=1 Tax=Limnoraphis robusta CCNP1315 TaxID=3110306 RepID=A0ABU5U5I1_9CYAN|nr:hypothetical protein [Limnoraphis robusta]MEA5496718.1 hypothetical protein [Limnoraphis robusta BA-68 BA1]MEA5522458.1 hypothetical protein [Limnoraphis robusta CCNP1315]MEA5541601.1 hypothetical protein [Limnoraphis robusta Tam1]MEA5546217.1 hypothetical protein [Limnoraphis robusta CCNP1324]
MLSIEDTFILVEERLPILGLKLASGVPSDVRGISDVDISLVHPEPQNLLHLMPEGTLKKKGKIYLIPLGDINLFLPIDRLI